MDEILNFISMYWLKYIEYIEGGGQPKKQDKLVARIQKNFQVSKILYTDTPSKVVVHDDLTVVSYVNENPEAEILFPEQVNGHHKLYAVHYKGCTTVLYGVADEH